MTPFSFLNTFSGILCLYTMDLLSSPRHILTHSHPISLPPSTVSCLESAKAEAAATEARLSAELAALQQQAQALKEERDSAVAQVGMTGCCCVACGCYCWPVILACLASLHYYLLSSLS